MENFTVLVLGCLQQSLCGVIVLKTNDSIVKIVIFEFVSDIIFSHISDLVHD